MTTTRGKLWIGVLAGAWLAAGGAWAHPDKTEQDLLLHFATGVHAIQNSEWPDLTHRLTARVQGEPKLEAVGPAQAVVFNGYTDWLLVAPDVASAAPALPKQAFSVLAWVELNETQPDGGLVGLVQDNGDYEKGWMLGYSREAFTFVLSTVKTDDGNGKHTRLVGKTPIEPGRWHLVAATYDGSRMQLYVDGRLDGESAEQSGDVLYPERGRYVVGAFVDDNEVHPMDGGLSEIKVYGRALDGAEIAAVASRNAPFLAWRASINRDLQFVVKPYLQGATAESMTVMAETSKPARMTVEYGERQPLRLRVDGAGVGAIQGVTLAGLRPYTRYFYRVTCEDEAGHLARADVGTFQTVPGPEQAWAFGILGDTQRNPEVTRRCAEGIFALRPNFLLHLGDVVDDGYAKQQWVYELFEPCSRLLAHVPVFPVIGNHEKNSHWYYDYFHLPPPEYWYTFTCGNAQFFMIDSNKECSRGSEQYRWLEKELAASKATWKFTAHHHPCFSSDEDDYGDTWKGKPDKEHRWGERRVQDLVPLYEQYGVDIAFAGHIHSYERTWPILQMAVNQARGVRYIVSGGGGGGLEQAGPQRSWFTVHVHRAHHYCFAAVQDRSIEFKAYDLEGRLFDHFQLTKPAAADPAGSAAK